MVVAGHIRTDKQWGKRSVGCPRTRWSGDLQNSADRIAAAGTAGCVLAKDRAKWRSFEEA